MAGAAAPAGAGLSATMASVVISRPATEAASRNAVVTTLAGSTIPAADQVAIGFVLRVKAGFTFAVQHFADNNRAFNTGVFRDLTHRRFQGPADDVDTGLDVGIVA